MIYLYHLSSLNRFCILFIWTFSFVQFFSDSETDANQSFSEGLFRSWSDESGLESVDISQRNYGVAVADLNFDGEFEIIVAGFSGSNIVLHYNQMENKFENIAVKGSPYENVRDEDGQAIGLCACDIDGDGTEEIYFLNTNNAYAGLSSYGDKLFKWRDGKYIDLYSDPVNKDLSAKNYAGRSVACLDRFGSGKYGFMIATYANKGKGQFALIEMDEFHPENDVDKGHIVLKNTAEESGLMKSTGGRGIVVGPILNSDGRSDIFFGNEGNSMLENHGDNFLFKNIGNGTYIDVAKQLDITDNSEAARGVALADFNNDGLLDIVCSNWEGPNRIYIQKQRSDGTRYFSDVATPDLQNKSMVRTVMVADFDNDKSLEVIINNINDYNTQQPNLGFKVTSYGSTNLIGISKISIGEAVELDMYGTGGAYLDVDKDGILELFLSHGESVPQPMEIYKVQNNLENNWIRVYPRTKYGAPARGATVTVVTRSGDSLMRVIDGGSGYLCQMEPVAHFGLNKDIAVSLLVKYPDGKIVEKVLTENSNKKMLYIVHPDFENYQRAQKASNLTMANVNLPEYNRTEL